MQGIHGISGAELEQIRDINVGFGILSTAQGLCGLKKRGNPWILMKMSLFWPIFHPSPIPGGASLGKEVTLGGCSSLGHSCSRSLHSRLWNFSAPAGFGLCSFA